jgi:UDP-glucose 4-epimerase
VITGGAGFIGSHVADDLVGESDVILVDHLGSGRKENVASALAAGAKFVKRDLLKGDLRPIFRKADTVYHLAANPDVRLGKQGPKIHVEQNVLMTYRVLEACRVNKVRRVVFASTSTVYGEAKLVPTPEDYGPLEPISLYGATKLACESLLGAYAHTFGLQAVVFRMANVCGGRSGHGVVPDLVRKLLKDPKHLEIIGSEPGTSKSYAYIDDVIAGFRAGLAAAQGPVNVFNLGSIDAISVRQIADALCDELRLEGVEYHWTGGTGAGRGWVGDVRSMSLAIERLRATGWAPRSTSEQAVRRAAADAWARFARRPKRAR